MNINFLRHSRVCLAVSAILVASAIASLCLKGGPRYGIEFTGGVLLQAELDQAPDLARLREELATQAPGATAVAGSAASHHLLSVTAPATVEPGKLRASLEHALTNSGARFTVRSFEGLGPQIGAELRRQALVATAVASAGMLAYVALRFEFIYGAAAVIAVAHDAVVTLGALSISNQEVTLNVMAALLTLVGYSMNDTIVIFDRLRENRMLLKDWPVRELVALSISQTLRRTLLTSGLTLIAVLALLLFGGAVLRGFALTLTIGLVVGTYSSIFIASPIVIWRGRRG